MSGFSLVEIVLALGLVSFVLVAVIGLFSVGLTGTRESGETIDAANLAAEILNKRLAAPTEVLPNLDGQPFGLPQIPDVSTLPTAKPPLTEVVVGPGGYTADDGFRLGYAMWRDAGPVSPTDSRLIHIYLVLATPANAPLLQAATRHEVFTSIFVP